MRLQSLLVASEIQEFLMNKIVKNWCFLNSIFQDDFHNLLIVCLKRCPTGLGKRRRENKQHVTLLLISHSIYRRGDNASMVILQIRERLRDSRGDYEEVRGFRGISKEESRRKEYCLLYCVLSMWRVRKVLILQMVIIGLVTLRMSILILFYWRLGLF